MLIKYLESLMGTADYEALLQAKDQQLCSISSALDNLHNETDRCVPAGRDIIAVISAHSIPGVPNVLPSLSAHPRTAAVHHSGAAA